MFMWLGMDINTLYAELKIVPQKVKSITINPMQLH